MPNDRCPCMFQSVAISCSMRVSHAAHSAFFWQGKQKKPKPALINEVQFHLACPAVIVPFKVLPALPFGKAALLPLNAALQGSCSGFGCPDPKLGRLRNASPLSQECHFVLN